MWNMFKVKNKGTRTTTAIVICMSIQIIVTGTKRG